MTHSQWPEGTKGAGWYVGGWVVPPVDGGVEPSPPVVGVGGGAQTGWGALLLSLPPLFPHERRPCALLIEESQTSPLALACAISPQVTLTMTVVLAYRVLFQGISHQSWEVALLVPTTVPFEFVTLSSTDALALLAQ